MPRAFALGAILVLLVGGWLATLPEVRYVAGEAVFEVHMLRASVPLDEVPERWKPQVALVQQVKAFAIDRLGLSPSQSYTRFYDTGGQPVGWALQAAPADRLIPYQWTYPILGAVPYKGFATRAEADAAAVPLMEQGYDTVVWPIPAFSTLGWLPDPLTSNLLEEDSTELGATIIHELFHGTVYWPGDADLNETMAQFVGMAGIAQYFPEGSAQAQQAADAWADEKTFTAFINTLVADLQKLYASPLSRAEKRQQRRTILREAGVRFQRIAFRTTNYARFRPALLNNANLVGFVGYHKDLAEFQEAYDLLQHRDALLVAFLKRVDPRHGLQGAVEELRVQGPSVWLERHPELPAPIARHTIVPRLPAAAVLALLLMLRAWLLRHDKGSGWLRAVWWLLALGALAGVVGGTMPPAVAWVGLAGMVVLMLGRPRWQQAGRWLVALEALLLAVIGGQLWLILPLLLVLRLRWRA